MGQLTIHKGYQNMQEKGILKILLKRTIRLAYRKNKFNMKNYSRFHSNFWQKRGKIGYDGNNNITGTKMHDNRTKQTADINFVVVQTTPIIIMMTLQSLLRQLNAFLILLRMIGTVILFEICYLATILMFWWVFGQI